MFGRNREDPFKKWMLLEEMPGVRLSRRQKARGAGKMLLDFLEVAEAEMASEKPDQWRVLHAASSLALISAEWDEKPIRQAVRLYSRLLETGRIRGGDLQSCFLDIIGRAAQEHTVPFWAEMIKMTIPRERFGKRRKRYAGAALAWLVVKRACGDALEVLLEASQDESWQVRLAAVQHLRLLCGRKGLTMPPAVWTRIERIAVADSCFEPRHMARMALLEAGRAIPGAAEDRILGFEVRLSGCPQFRAVLELSNRSSFDSLASMVLAAFDWDDDHLYEFHLTGKQADRDFIMGRGGPMGWGCEAQDDEPAPDADLFEAGIEPKHKFVFFFDFGDCNSFSVRATYSARPAPGARYPRIVSLRGTPPEQYPEW